MYRVWLYWHVWVKNEWRILTGPYGDAMPIGDATERMRLWVESAEDGEPVRAWLVPV